MEKDLVRKDEMSRMTPVYISLTLLIFVAYFNSLFNPFIWDDKWLIVGNPGVQGGWHNVVNAFRPGGWTLGREQEPSRSFYRPLQTLHFILDYRIWRLNPFGYHLSNTLLHIFNTILLYIVSLRILKDHRASFLGAAIFAVHPVNTEAVSFIASRGDLLCGLFLLSAFYLFIKSVVKSQKSEEGKTLNSQLSILNYLFSLLLYCLALLGKEMALVFPIILVVYNYLYERRRVKEIVPYFIILFLYILLRVFGLEVFLGQHRLRAGFLTVSLSAAVAVFDYIRLLFLPYPLKTYYTLIWYNTLSLRVVLALLFLIVCMGLILWLWRKKERTLLFLIIWPFLSLIPVLNIGSLGEFSMAERYLYIPSLGFCMLIGGVAIRFFDSERCRKVLMPLSLVVITIFTGMTIDRNRVWGDDETFYQEMVKGAPDSPLPHANLGLTYKRMGYLDKAIREFEEAVRLAKGNHDLHNTLGVLYIKKGDMEKAIKALKRAVALKQDYAEAYNHLGIAYAEVGMLEEAVSNFEIALSLKPGFKEASNNLKKAMDRAKER